MGLLLLEGGAEFGGRMAEPDKQAMTLAGGREAAISIIPAAAAPDNNHKRAGKNGVDWFCRLGATNVSVLPLIDRSSANDPEIAETLVKAKLIYLLGGFPRYLADVLNGSDSWQAMLNAFQSGAVIAGSSAGAMVLCEYYYDPVSSQANKGLNLIKRTCILPHYSAYGKNWVPRLRTLLPNFTLLGIDEETGVLYDTSQNNGRIYGKGTVMLHHNDQVDKFGAQQNFVLNNATA